MLRRQRSSVEINPAEIDIASRYKLLIGCIVPRPIAVVSTISVAGVLNLAPFSFFNGVGSNPLTLLFCPANTPEGAEKDTLRNCKPIAEGGTGEFVVNLAPLAIIRQVVATAEPLSPEESEFDLSGLMPSPSRVVRPARVLESPVAFECRTLQVVRTGPGSPNAGNVVIGSVVHIHIADHAINERFHTDPSAIDLVGRMGGSGYCTTRDRFDIPVGKAALSAPDPLAGR